MAYLNVIEIESAIDALAQNYPAISERILLPHPTHEGRITSALRIGNSGETGSNDLLIIGGLHAREWVPPDAIISLSADLLEAYTTNSGLSYGDAVFKKEQVKQLVDSVNIYLYPCANPDGRHYSQTKDPMWRKNRRMGANGSGCCGVDLNREFQFPMGSRNEIRCRFAGKCFQ